MEQNDKEREVLVRRKLSLGYVMVICYTHGDGAEGMGGEDGELDTGGGGQWSKMPNRSEEYEYNNFI